MLILLYLEGIFNRPVATTYYSSYPTGTPFVNFKLGVTNDGKYTFSHTTSGQTQWLVLCCDFKARMDYNFYEDSKFNIYVPPKSDGLKVVFSVDNSKNDQEATYTYQEEVGISRTNGVEISESFAVEIGAEIKGAFSFGMSYTKTWTKSTSEMWSKVSTHTLSTRVAPHEILDIKQLQGTYGEFKIYSNYVKLEPRTA